MSECPSIVLFDPQVRRTEFVAQFQEACRSQSEVIHHLGEVALRTLSIEAADECDPLVASEMFVADLLGGIIRCAAEPELYVGSVIVKPIEFVVQAVVLAVRAL